MVPINSPLLTASLYCSVITTRTATGYGMDGPGSNPSGVARYSAPVQTGPGAHPASCTMGTGSFPGVKSGRGVTLTPHPLLVSWSRRKSRTIPLLTLWAVRSVQSLSACTRMHLTFIFYNDTHLYRQKYPLSRSYNRVGLYI